MISGLPIPLYPERLTQKKRVVLPKKLSFKDLKNLQRKKQKSLSKRHTLHSYNPNVGSFNPNVL